MSWEILKSQFVTSSSWGGRRYLPYVYAEQGIIALSKSILPIPFPRYSGSTPSPLVLAYPLGGWPIARQTTVVTSPTTLPRRKWRSVVLAHSAIGFRQAFIRYGYVEDIAPNACPFGAIPFLNNSNPNHYGPLPHAIKSFRVTMF